MSADVLLAALALKQAGAALPWYDSQWLRAYGAALKVIDRVAPAKRAEFVAAFERLRTPADFAVRKLDRVFDANVLRDIRAAIAALPPTLHEQHEIERFGRTVVHDHPFFNDLQRTLVPLASELAGEAVEASYNFLSLYRGLGVCEPHIDAPTAKWTLDLCVEQSHVWPIHFSQVVSWPGGPEGKGAEWAGDDWEQRIKRSPDLAFSAQALAPGQAVWFSGSSQFHYRDRLAAGADGFCTLVFFHFLPAGMAEVVEPSNWPRLFDLPELAAVVAASHDRRVL